MVSKKSDETYCGKRLMADFYEQDVLTVAPSLLGKILVVKQPSGDVLRYKITETEAYRGHEDRACHASKGKTRRTEVMFRRGGYVYVYFVYGMYWMLNVVTGPENEPQAALIRGIEGYEGPGRLTRVLGIDGTFYGEDLTSSKRIWIEDNGYKASYITSPRIGINYAGQPWVDMPWRFILTA
ncbi:MAG TPA: DNA-3-methyladenine glycosylase [Bacteroidales bacterium]|nr:DNA-3-methyladenine glycosylase [Bacteroidales bacterium]